jgi:hypothetical protein
MKVKGLQFIAIVASLGLAVVMRGRGTASWLALAAFALITATLVIFVMWTQPANAATTNWTVVPDNWQRSARNGSTPTPSTRF